MADELLESSDGRTHGSLPIEEQQDIYDRAARDYIDRLREMTPQQANAHFAKVEWIKNYVGKEVARCQRCGDTVLELKWSADHVEWQCLEPTCRHAWEWKRR